MNLIKLCLRRVLRSQRSLPSLLCKLAVYAAVELFKPGFRKPNARNGTQPEPRLEHNFICFSKLAIQLVSETDGKFRVLENSKLSFYSKGKGYGKDKDD